MKRRGRLAAGAALLAGIGIQCSLQDDYKPSELKYECYETPFEAKLEDEFYNLKLKTRKWDRQNGGLKHLQP
ncbi:MAG: hypothetical protein ACE5FT_06265 [Candidatus Nanoarchaeia archaeon]